MALVSLLVSVHAFAQERSVPDLKDVPDQQRVTAVKYCRGAYEVALGDGGVRTFKEYDLSFKVDSSANGPSPAKPALVPTGRVGDRAMVVFAVVEELRAGVKAECRN